MKLFLKHHTSVSLALAGKDRLDLNLFGTTEAGCGEKAFSQSRFCFAGAKARLILEACGPAEAVP